MILTIALVSGASYVFSELQLFGMNQPEGGTSTSCSGEPVELDGARAEIFRLHNEERTERGIPALCWNEQLARAATGHSEDMMERAFFAHETPEGMEPSDRTLAAGYDSPFVAENIMIHHMSSGFEPNIRDSEEIVQGWMNSPGHRKNLLDPRLKEVGVGTVYGRFGYETNPSGAYTVNFGTPVDQIPSS
ncbi:MAG: CAP domain-containing protein [Rubrobacter sp.]